VELNALALIVVTIKFLYLFYQKEIQVQDANAKEAIV
jgi:hypothetical protein